jgi:predicted ArsR family transcriptional regulator
MSGFNRRFMETTRGQILSALRRGSRTVEEIAGVLGLTDNAIRSHLSTLERDGLIHQTGVRRGTGAGKPATVYEIPAAAEPMFSKAYVPLLEAVLDELSVEIPAEQREQILRNVGHRLAAGMTVQRGGDLDSRVAEASRILNSLGGDTQVEHTDGKLSIRGCGCPLSAATARRPEVCKAMETLLQDVIGAPVRESCDRTGRPQCCFQIQEIAEG